MAQGSSGGGWGLLAIVVGLVLLADPKCKHGCRTVAEHLFEGGVRLLGS